MLIRKNHEWSLEREAFSHFIFTRILLWFISQNISKSVESCFFFIQTNNQKKYARENVLCGRSGVAWWDANYAVNGIECRFSNKQTRKSNIDCCCCRCCIERNWHGWWIFQFAIEIYFPLKKSFPPMMMIGIINCMMKMLWKISGFFSSIENHSTVYSHRAGYVLISSVLIEPNYIFPIVNWMQIFVEMVCEFYRFYIEKKKKKNASAHVNGSGLIKKKKKWPKPRNDSCCTWENRWIKSRRREAREHWTSDSILLLFFVMSYLRLQSSRQPHYISQIL